MIVLTALGLTTYLAAATIFMLKAKGELKGLQLVTTEGGYRLPKLVVKKGET